jgi:hypothetical protein
MSDHDAGREDSRDSVRRQGFVRNAIDGEMTRQEILAEAMEILKGSNAFFIVTESVGNEGQSEFAYAKFDVHPRMAIFTHLVAENTMRECLQLVSRGRDEG